MSRPIDEKVVKMSLDNQSFLSKVKTTIAGLGDLSKGTDKVKGVDLSKTEAGVRGIGKAAKEADMSKLASGVETIKSKFSTLGVIAITTLQNITNRAVNAGLQLAKSFTVQPVMAGLDMYQNKLKSIQTILANTQGKENLNSVTKSLDDLNTYANKTVYSFQDMTTNMGTFTAAGVDLKTAQTAIKGIGNLAASSGSSTQQAGMAMYQLSQAIAAGKVGLQDWNSVVNAGMGGKKFQTALQANAKAMGKNVSASKSFRDSLQDGWLTTDVLMKTLNQFANDKSMLKAATQVKTFSDLMDTLQDEMKSGWAKTWELIVGDFNQAPKLWTAVHDVLGGIVDDSANARNNLLETFNKLGGRNIALQGLANGFQAVKSVLKEVQEAFREVFPPITAKQLVNIVQGFRDWVSTMNPTWQQLQQIHSVAKGFFSLLDIGWKAVKLVAGALKALIPDNLGGNLLELAANIGNMVTNFDEGVTTGGKFGSVLKVVHKAVNSFADGVGSALGGMGKFLDWVEKMGKALWSVLKPALDKIGGSFKKFFGNISFGDLLGAGGIGGLFLAGKKLGSLSDTIGDFGDKLQGMFKTDPSQLKVLDSVKETLQNFQTGIKAASLLAIAGAVLMLAKSLTMIGKLDVKDISKGLEGIGVSLFAMTKTLNAISKMSMGKGTGKAVALILSVSTSMVILSNALTTLSKIKSTSLVKALGALAVMLGELVLAIKGLSMIDGTFSTSSKNLIALGAAIYILSQSLAVLAKIKADQLVKGLEAMGVALAELAVFVRAVNNTKLNAGTAVGVVLVASAMAIIAGAIKLLAKVNPDNIVKGLVTIAGILAEVVLFSAMVKGSNLIAASAGLTVMAVALNLMIPPILAFGSMPWEKIEKGLTTIGVALAEVVVAMTAAKGGLSGAAAITVVAVALNLLIPPILTLGNLGIEKLVLAVGGLAAIFGVIAIAAIAMSPASVALMAFGVAIGLVGVAVLAIGTGLAAFAAALVALASVTAKNIDSIVKSFDRWLTDINKIIPHIVDVVVKAVIAMADGIAKSVPRLADDGLKLIQGFLQAIADHIGEIVKAGIEIVANFIEGIASQVGPLIDAGTDLMIQFINGMAESIRDNGPMIVQSVLGLVESLLEIVVQALVQVGQILFGWLPGASDMLGNMGNTATKALRDTFHIDTVGQEQVQAYLNAINSGADSANTASLKVVKAQIAGLSTAKQQAVVQALASGMSYKDALNSTNPAIAKVARDMGQTTWNNAKKDLSGQGKASGDSYGNGVGKSRAHAGNNARSLADAGASSLSKRSNKDWSKAGENFGKGFGEGISHAKDAVVGFARGLAKSAVGALKNWLHIKSPSRVTMEAGDYFGQGFGIGIDGQSKSVASKAMHLASSAVNALKSQAGYIQDAMNGAMDLQPVITPTVDTSGIGNTDFSGTMNAAAGAYAGQYGAAPVNNETYTFGDVNFTINGTTQSTATELMGQVKTQFDTWLVDELRKVKKV